VTEGMESPTGASLSEAGKRDVGATIEVRLADGSTVTLSRGATAADLVARNGRNRSGEAIAAVVDGRVVDLATALEDGAEVALVSASSAEGLAILRHSTAHVLAQAVLRLWPGARYAIGPVIDDGFYYDFELPRGEHFSEEDLARIEEAMRAIVAEDQSFVRQELSFDAALALFAGQPYKQEIIEAVRAGADELDASSKEAAAGGVSVYRNEAGSGARTPSDGAFVDLCRGPHVPSTGHLGHFKLMRVAGAYWRGDERRPQLQRIYGTAWPSEAALSEYLYRLEEAERRDHRKLGIELDLFSFPDEIGSGLPVFHPRGGLLRRVMEDYSRARHAAAGYEFVYTPHIAHKELFETSGHLQSFAEGMYPPMDLEGGQQYYLKPMNCPFHILVYKSRQRSYRELPLRLFELGTVYRHEKSGVVHGLTRVRGMTMDDSHIFCAREQLPAEIRSVLEFVLDVLEQFGLSDTYLELSTRPGEKAVGADEEWEEATELLRSVAAEMGLALVPDEGGGAFYGPKISVQARDAIGRHHQISTVQLDYQLPRRFDLSYVAPDNTRRRPAMLHRALFGSVERFMAILLEHYAGALPTWLMPEQVRVLPVAGDHQAYADLVAQALRGAGIRVAVEGADEPLNARVRRAKLAKLPYILVVGGSDVEAGTVGLNRRGSERPERGVPLDAVVAMIQAEIEARGSPEQARVLR